MNLKNKTICVTGGAGFIGSALCRELVSKGSKVISLDNYSTGKLENLKELESQIEIVKADITDLKSLEKPLSQSQVIYHLAAVENRQTCQKNPRLAFENNINGTSNVLSLCSNAERVVFMSSEMVYGESRYLPIDEKHPMDGREVYAVSKIADEYLCKAYNFAQNVPFTIIRNFNTFGPKQSQTSLIPSLIMEGLTKNQIEVWAPGVVRDFLYIDNCVDALVKVVESESAKNEIVNVGSGKGITTGEVAEIICKYLNVAWIDLKKPMPEGAKFISDTKKIKSLTDWKPKISLEKGLERTIEYYKSII